MLLEFIHRPAFIQNTVLFIFQNNVSETGFCLCFLVKPTQLGLIDRASPYFRTPVPAPRWVIQARHSTNHPRELKNIKSQQVWGLATENYHDRNYDWREDTSYGTNTRKTKFSTQSIIDGVVGFFYTLLLWYRWSRWERCPSWIDWSDGVAETCGRIPCMWCLVHSARLRFIATYFAAVFICMLDYFWFNKQTLCQIIFVLLNAYF
jgi:hypothetical protein